MPPSEGVTIAQPVNPLRLRHRWEKQKEEEAANSRPVTLSPSQQTKVLLAKPSQMLHSSLVTFR